jgi:hypothetical protein
MHNGLIILGLIILFITRVYLLQKKTNSDKPILARNSNKLLIFTILVLLTLLVIDSLLSSGFKSYYCISDNKCITVWKRTNGDIYIIHGAYRNRKKPTDDYVKVLNSRYDNIHLILSKDDKLLIDVDKSATVIKQSSNSLMALYKDNKALNDSLYTYFEGKYKRYNKDVEFISINIKENYATDKTGKKLK